jgi:uncharacterized radical SAM superfamily Fe-S cluster-containing enzyme
MQFVSMTNNQKSTATSTNCACAVAKAEVFQPQRTPLSDPLTDMRRRMQCTDQWHPNQMAGRRWPIACVSLEITQRCNLDCTLCYLSNSSEAVRDFPLEEVFRRIDMIAQHYGPGTDVQVSGGEPTLRRRDELVAIVKRLVQLGLRASLFTNGVKASRSLLTELSEAGLTDVVFHVDSTQQRDGCRTEQDLNALRQEYIERARNLPVGVFFSTTVHAGNIDDIPKLAAFFAEKSDVVRLASFQLQAETGRGILGARGHAISNDSVATLLQRGVSVSLNFNTLAAGHRDCTRCAVMLVINGQVYDVFADDTFIQRFMDKTATAHIDRATPWRAARSLGAALLMRPKLWLPSVRWVLAFTWKARKDLVVARGRVQKLTFITHNFMDACQLDRERIDACAFMAITQDGPLSMCAYNARRDSYLLQPLQTSAGTWQPLRDQTQEAGTESQGMKS